MVYELQKEILVKKGPAVMAPIKCKKTIQEILLIEEE
jgi:hypothetical protein